MASRALLPASDFPDRADHRNARQAQRLSINALARRGKARIVAIERDGDNGAKCPKTALQVAYEAWRLHAPFPLPIAGAAWCALLIVATFLASLGHARHPGIWDRDLSTRSGP